MNVVFLDTAFLIALVINDDVHHEAAIAWKKSLRGPLLTTEYVLLEFADALCGPPHRQKAIGTVQELRNDNDVQIVPASTARMDEGLNFFARYADKSWSLTDCISFVVMHRESVTDVLTSDRDFEQAGFRALLRISPDQY